MTEGIEMQRSPSRSPYRNQILPTQEQINEVNDALLDSLSDNQKNLIDDVAYLKQVIYNLQNELALYQRNTSVLAREVCKLMHGIDIILDRNGNVIEK